MRPEVIKNPTFVVINEIDGPVNFYPLTHCFSLFRGMHAEFMISIREKVGIQNSNHEDLEIEEHEYIRLEQFFLSLSCSLLMVSDNTI